MSGLVANVQASDPLRGVKRSAPSGGGGVSSRLPAKSGRDVDPGGAVRAPGLQPNNRPNRGTNVTIPFARLAPLRFLDESCGVRLSPGDVAFVRKRPEGETDARDYMQDDATPPQQKRWKRQKERSQEHVKCAQQSSVSSFHTHQVLGIDGMNEMLRGGISNSDLRIGVNVLKIKKGDSSKVLPGEYGFLRNLEMLEEYSLDGVIISNDEPDSFASNGNRDNVLFNIAVQGKALLNNGFMQHQYLDEKGTSLSAYTGVEAHPRTSRDHMIQMNPKVSRSDAWNSSSYDFVAQLKGQYTAYPLQMFDRTPMVGIRLYVGLRAVQCTAKMLNSLKWRNGDPYNTKADHDYFYFQYMPYSQRICDMIDMPRSENPVVKKANSAEATNNTIDRDPFSPIKSKDWGMMVGAWTVGTVIDTAAARYPQFNSGPPNTSFQCMVNVHVDWRELVHEKETRKKLYNNKTKGHDYRFINVHHSKAGYNLAERERGQIYRGAQHNFTLVHDGSSDGSATQVGLKLLEIVQDVSGSTTETDIDQEIYNPPYSAIQWMNDLRSLRLEIEKVEQPDADLIVALQKIQTIFLSHAELLMSSISQIRQIAEKRGNSKMLISLAASINEDVRIVRRVFIFFVNQYAQFTFAARKFLDYAARELGKNVDNDTLLQTIAITIIRTLEDIDKFVEFQDKAALLYSYPQGNREEIYEVTKAADTEEQNEGDDSENNPWDIDSADFVSIQGENEYRKIKANSLNVTHNSVSQEEGKKNVRSVVTKLKIQDVERVWRIMHCVMLGAGKNLGTTGQSLNNVTAEFMYEFLRCESKTMEWTENFMQDFASLARGTLHIGRRLFNEDYERNEILAKASIVELIHRIGNKHVKWDSYNKQGVSKLLDFQISWQEFSSYFAQDVTEHEEPPIGSFVSSRDEVLTQKSILAAKALPNMLFGASTGCMEEYNDEDVEMYVHNLLYATDAVVSTPVPVADHSERMRVSTSAASASSTSVATPTHSMSRNEVPLAETTASEVRARSAAVATAAAARAPVGGAAAAVAPRSRASAAATYASKATSITDQVFSGLKSSGIAADTSASVARSQPPSPAHSTDTDSSTPVASKRRSRN